MGTPRYACETYTVGMAFRQVGRGSLKLQLPGGQTCLVIWKENTGGFDSQSSKEAFERRHSSATARKCHIKRQSVSMIFLLCPICFANRCRVLYRPNTGLWGCRRCHRISYKCDTGASLRISTNVILSSGIDARGASRFKSSINTERSRRLFSAIEYRELCLREKRIHRILFAQLDELICRAVC